MENSDKQLFTGGTNMEIRRQTQRKKEVNIAHDRDRKLQQSKSKNKREKNDKQGEVDKKKK